MGEAVQARKWLNSLSDEGFNTTFAFAGPDNAAGLSVLEQRQLQDLSLQGIIATNLSDLMSASYLKGWDDGLEYAISNIPRGISGETYRIIDQMNKWANDSSGISLPQYGTACDRVSCEVVRIK